MDTSGKLNKLKSISFSGLSAVLIVLGLWLVFGKHSNPGRPDAVPEGGYSVCKASSSALVTKVIDGDTIVVEGGYHVRLLGIDADERGYPCFQQAKERLEELILNRKVRLVKGSSDTDRYGRCLRYVFLGQKNIDLELVKDGLAVARFYNEEEEYRQEIQRAEKEAIRQGIGCKWSGSAGEQSVQAQGNLSWQRLIKKAGLPDIIDACRAGDYPGKERIIQGKVVDSYRTEKGTVFLNFGRPYPEQCFTAVIFSSYGKKFVSNPEDYYLNKIVRVRGRIKEYRGKPEIILKSPNQIEPGK